MTFYDLIRIGFFYIFLETNNKEAFYVLRFLHAHKQPHPVFATFYMIFGLEIFSKKDPYRSNLVRGIDCAHSRSVLTTLIQGKIGFLKRKLSFFAQKT